MYTVTFYSFKGGVGRSMALVNVAAQLVLSGRKVLLVDFDLEAPGLDTFKLGGPGSGALGIVDFVEKFRNTGIAPDINDFVHSASIDGQHHDRLWVMPAGRQDSAYSSRLASIDWQKLYGEFDGYLLFEDLKAQWKKSISPDYVLIDSRTGHTDVGGICTRQLPDAVVLLFFPNEQNRNGLEKVVKQIREEAKPPRNKEITLHFVISNVPDLDDEEEILSTSVRRLKESLEYEDLAATIHHYPSLSLLNQAIFTLSRPKSRLAQEYRQLAAVIRQNNLEDREGSLKFLGELQAMSTRKPPLMPLSDIEARLTEIRKIHAADGEILRKIATLRKQQRRYDEAVSLLDDATNAGLLDADLLISRAEMNASLENKSAAISDLKKLLNLAEVSTWDLVSAVRLLADLDPHEAEAVTTSRALSGLSTADQASLAMELMSSQNAKPVAESLLGSLASHSQAELNIPARVRNLVSLSLIRRGQFSVVKKILSPQGFSKGALPLEETFNYAMAVWGETGSPALDPFQDVLDRRNERGLIDANFLQCLALAYWAVGNNDQALRQLAGARALIATQGGETFSAWRYHEVSSDQFAKDLDAMERMINGEALKPLVLQDVSKE